MAAFASLTQEQRDTYLAFENDVRAATLQLRKVLNDAVGLQARWNAQILAVLAALDDNTIVPKASGLTGASSLDSDAELAVLYADLVGLLTTLNTAAKQQLQAKAIGNANLTA